jgi:hypothetical protein
MESDSRSGGPGKGALEEVMRERIRVTIESIVAEELEAALGAQHRSGSARFELATGTASAHAR